MKVASSGSVEGIRVGVGEGDGDGDCEDDNEGEAKDGKSAGVDDCGEVTDVVVVVVAVVDDAVNFSFSSAAKRTISFALTINASKSFNASDMSVAVFCAEVSTVWRMPSSNAKFESVNSP
jgi:hypothetical protein